MGYNLKSAYSSVDELQSRDRAISILYGRLPDTLGGNIVPINVDAGGNLIIGSTLTLATDDLDIGDVGIKGQWDSTLDDATVSPGEARLGIVKLSESPFFGGAWASTAGFDTALHALLTYDPRLDFTVGSLNVNVTGSTLPTGAATSANQTNGAQKAQIVDGSNNVIGSTANALDVNIKSGVTLEVNLDNANDDVVVYGNDGAVNRAIKTDAAGELQIDVLSSALPTGAATSLLQGTGNTSLASIDGKIPAAPSQEHVTAVSPHAARLTDGTVFYKATTPADTQPVSLADSTTRELGRVLASDQLYVTDTITTAVVAYANARPTFGDLDVRRYKTKKIVMKNTSANAGRITISGSIDGGVTYDEIIVNNAALAAGNTSVTNLSEAFTHIKLEARAQGAGNAATIESRAYAMGT